jgi:hypothetical protein
MSAINNEKFMELVERMFDVGGEWKVSTSKAGTFLTYEGETHEITMRMADAMFTTIPRKATG